MVTFYLRIGQSTMMHLLVLSLLCFIDFKLAAIPPERQSIYSKCVEGVRAFNAKCESFVNDNQNTNTICESQKRVMILKCQKIRINEECQKCFKDLDVLVSECVGFYQPASKGSDMAIECVNLKTNLAEACSTKCPVCEDSLCLNGGRCLGGEFVYSCRCPVHTKGVHCETSRCSQPCQNNGICAGDDLCSCPYPYAGLFCDRVRLGSKYNPARSASEILLAGDSLGSGVYWIQPRGEPRPALTYCDMKFDGGGWMLASYGYVEVGGDDHRNKLMLNMNHPEGYLWLPQQRQSSHGLITLSQGAKVLARSASYMIMAGGNNPETGGINEYAYVYKIDLRNITQKITFANHNPYYGASGSRNIPRMHLQAFTIYGLKGDLRNYTRFSLAESLGVTSRDSFPTGYGFNERKEQYEFFSSGPFFPSVHTGAGKVDSFRYGKFRSFTPDVEKSCYRFSYRGWYTAINMNNFGQMAIWFK